MIDAHAHLSDPRLKQGVDQIAQCLQKAGLKRLVLGGVDAAEWELQARLTAKMPEFVSSVIGLHPWTVRDQDDATLEEMFHQLLASVDNVTAIGEVGVDFYPKRTVVQVERQSRWCRRQIELAQALGKPAVFHVVRGHDVLQSILKDFKLKAAMVHGFKGNMHVAKFYLERGYLLSLSERSFHGLPMESYSWLPKTHFVLESDAPSPKQKVSDVRSICDPWIRSLERPARILATLWSIPYQSVWALAEENLNRWLMSSVE